MIVVPIVAAQRTYHLKNLVASNHLPGRHGGHDGSADAVDLGVDEMKEVVSACHGCLVWGGHVNLSPADDILISVERPLSLDTREQMVASIMSKKIAAGSTHLLIDLPVGPAAKLTNATEAMRLRKLFEFVGDHFGIAVEVITTDGRQPIGSGIGPVLEAQDVMAVLANDPKAPPDLRETLAAFRALSLFRHGDCCVSYQFRQLHDERRASRPHPRDGSSRNATQVG